MTARRTSSQSLKSISGAGVFALGLLLLFVNLDGVAAYTANFVSVSAYEAQGVLPALGLAGLHAFEAYAFDHDAFLSGLRQILVSFWPLTVMAIGAALLRNAWENRFANSQAIAGLQRQESDKECQIQDR